MRKTWPIVCLLISTACGSTATPRAHAPTLADAAPSTCEHAEARGAPLLVEWSGTGKANLEANLHRGAIAVEYTGCEMRLLVGCQLPGQYVWQKTTTTTDVLDIDNADELHAALPLGVWDLEGALSQTGRLSVYTTSAGQMTLKGANVQDVPLGGSCSQATHLLQAVSIGAFRLDAGGAVQGSVWEVRRSNETLCTTPCTRWVDPAQTFRLRSYDGDGQPSAGGYKVDLPALRPAVTARDRVRAPKQTLPGGWRSSDESAALRQAAA